MVAALLAGGSCWRCQEAPPFPRAWENTPHLTLTPRVERNVEARAQVGSAILAGRLPVPLRRVMGKGPGCQGPSRRRRGKNRAPGQARGKIPSLGPIPHAKRWVGPGDCPLLLATLSCAVFSEFVPRSYPASHSPGRLGEVPRVDRAVGVGDCQILLFSSENGLD